MDVVGVGYECIRAYVYGLVTATTGGAVWVGAPDVTASPRIASAWFAVAGFGMLVVAMLTLTHFANRAL
ncbi:MULTISPECIES: hypothetical protein [Halobacterium]|uniref:Uncharacterized protein n=4 Tax=Halobacterium salinarum TaxID=2242 RepID=Q9HQE4_HALSA|nr:MULTISPECIES: hypothetical protein [Halobacterium]AAG19571.1 hypothetical protein VNG_1200H [Halobacterium salinarum NRC-1]MBB6090258.1 hypothetical protein [Halobacterium salinarum]MCF2165081.1 hypothetical protein [Halobacterium salinarum]MCF2168110.1 hypothetical protein [Halobacterium salinarum]MCF2206991.1 hypothetical protein [Halobacterium salinarum]